MREKRLRKQEMLEQGKVGEPETEPSHNQNASSTVKRKAPSSPRSSSSPSSKTPCAGSTERVPAHKLITLRSTAAPAGNGVAAPETTAAVVTVQSSSPQQAGTKSSSRVAPDKKTQVSSALSPLEQPRVTGASTAEEAMDTNRESPEHTADTKGTVSLVLSLIFLSQVHSKHLIYAQVLPLTHSHSGGCIREHHGVSTMG